MTDWELLAQAEAVLRGNDVGEYTRPSARLYPHQWNWDSAFNSIGWAYFDWDRATREIESMLAAQWTNGMVPHVRYNPTVTDYAPGPEWWINVPVRRAGEMTSGISQPPVLASAARHVGLLQADRDVRLRWWERVYDPLKESLQYFARHRVTGSSPLIVLVHPWESGIDNSPLWDFAVAQGHRPSRPYRRVDTTKVAAAERPTSREYDLYMFLVELIASHHYEMADYLPRTPFAVYDVLFNAAWYRAVADLNRIAGELGRPPVLLSVEMDAFRRAFHTRLWDEDAGLFLDFDLKAGQEIGVHTLIGLTPIYAELVDAAQAAAMYDRYKTRCRGCFLLPSVPPDQQGFESSRYHRGPVWVQSNWMIARGLEDLGLGGRGRELADATIELVRRSGWFEHFDAYSGRGAGTDQFSWTAALTIDLIRRPIS